LLQKANRRASPSTHRTPYGRVHTAFRMSAHRPASTVPVIRRRPGDRRVAAGSTVGQDGSHADYGVLSTAVAAATVLSRRRSPCPEGATAARLRSRVSLVGHSERLSETAGKKCVAKCATQFLLIGGKLDALRAGPH
jgi:hypothetical protein